MRVITNTFKINQLDEDELPYVVSPFIGCSGKVEITIHECIGTEEERKALFDHVMDLFNQQKRAAGFLTPVHSALNTYWYNVSSGREKYDVRGLKNVLKGKPILYCGAGPSLARDIDVVKQIAKEGSAFLVTGGTGIKILHNNGIVPDLCIAVDPFDQEQERFEGLSTEWQKSTHLLASNSLNPTCYEGWKGKLIAAEGLNCMPLGDFIEEDPIKLDEGPVGVTTWMLNIAEYLGTKEIYLIGTDLCYGAGGETYADDMDMTAGECIDIDTDGKNTKTNWIYEANFIGETILEKGYTMYNASKGLDIPNTINIDLYDMFKDIKGDPIKLKLKKWPKSKTDKIKKNMKSFIDDLNYTERNLGDTEIQQQRGYIHLIKQYDDIQEYQYWRTGMYNYSLIREVCTANVKIMESILKGAKYEGELPYGALGSPQTPSEKRKIRTGSKHRAEVKNETVSSGNNTSKNG